MKSNIYVGVYALTLLISAALLFSVQPMFSKMILPLLGGTPQVWNTAMLFFQLMLLAGYAYAHGTSKFLNIRLQAILHLVLLAVAAIVLPIAIPESWTPPTHSDPTFWQLSLMAATVGAPFFVLAGSAPMFQRWFTYTGHKDASNPYFLYGASNFGSMSALLAYPFVIEPFMNLFEQTYNWAFLYGGLFVAVLICIACVWNKSKPQDTPQSTTLETSKISNIQRFKWLTFAFLPSSLMLGVTTFVTTDIASVPLIWILPLALYLSTFIIVFARKEVISKDRLTKIHGGAVILLITTMFVPAIPPLPLIVLHISIFFISALLCHKELADAKPSADKLTEFYLIISIGGALGGVFNAIIAPQFFVVPIEYFLVLAAICFVRYINREEALFKDKFDIGIFAFICSLTLIYFFFDENKITYMLAFGIIIGLGFFLERRKAFAISASVCLIINAYSHIWVHSVDAKIIHNERNFFGVIRVAENDENERLLMHGTTLHGVQIQKEEYKLQPTSYYGPNTTFDQLFSVLNAIPGPQEVAILGLGIGNLACFTKEGRHFDFYEIDPDIIRIAQDPEFFTFLSDCGSPYNIIVGDARLKIKDAEDEKYDLIIADAFSSDNIPVHLLTLEALKLYKSKLKPDGVLGLHISNRYLDLEPVIAEAAKALEMETYGHLTLPTPVGDSEYLTQASHFLVLSNNSKVIQALKEKGWSPTYEDLGIRLWTDQYSNIISVLGDKFRKKRVRTHNEQEALKAAESQAK